MAAGEKERGEGEGEGEGGGRERETTLRQNHSTSTAHQSIDTTRRSMTEASIRKVYRSTRMDSLDIVSVY